MSGGMHSGTGCWGVGACVEGEVDTRHPWVNSMHYTHCTIVVNSSIVSRYSNTLYVQCRHKRF